MEAPPPRPSCAFNQQLYSDHPFINVYRAYFRVAGAALALTLPVNCLVNRRRKAAEAPRATARPFRFARLGTSCERRLLRWQIDVCCLGISVQGQRARDAYMATTGSG